jgi:hypothetical protein
LSYAGRPGGTVQFFDPDGRWSGAPVACVGPGPADPDDPESDVSRIGTTTAAATTTTRTGASHSQMLFLGGGGGGG